MDSATTSTTEVDMWDEVADGDRADQATVVEVDSTDTPETVQQALPTDSLPDTAEADPMDVADQHRITQVDDDPLEEG